MTEERDHGGEEVEHVIRLENTEIVFLSNLNENLKEPSRRGGKSLHEKVCLALINYGIFNEYVKGY